MKNSFLKLIAFSALTIVLACNSSNTDSGLRGDSVEDYLKISKENFNNLMLIKGETVYVPIYSDIYSTDLNRKIKLSATLSIRNTSMQNEIIVSKVDYYDTHGKLISKYITEPIKLKPLQTVNYVVDYNEVLGGTGANFIVDWVAEQEVSEPVIQAVMIGTSSSLGISFVCEGKVIKYTQE